jgi:hypothetical protein
LHANLASIEQQLAFLTWCSNCGRYREDTGTFLLCGQELLAEAAAGVGGVLSAECAFVLQQPKDEGVVQVPRWLSAQRVAGVTENVMRKITGWVRGQFVLMAVSAKAEVCCHIP